MTTAMIVQDVLENEAILLGLFGLAVAGFAIYFEYIIRRWSWIPRKHQRKNFGERW